MRFDDLKRRERVFIDANIFIYNFGGQSIECKEFLSRCAKYELRGVTSTFILAEVLHRLMVGEAIEKGLITSKNPVQKLKRHPEIIKELSTYISNVRKIPAMNIHVYDLSLDIIQESGRVREKEGLLTNDSLTLATMKRYRVPRLITSDDDFDHVKGIRVYKPSDI
jgi:predicted nucleic acid-binding protein